MPSSLSVRGWLAWKYRDEKRNNHPVKLAAPLIVAVVLAGCGGRQTLSNGDLAQELSRAFGSKDAVECSTAAGYYPPPIAHQFNRRCKGIGAERALPIFVDGLDWCVLLPQGTVPKLPHCPVTHHYSGTDTLTP